MKARESKKAKVLFNDEKIGRAIIKKIQSSNNGGSHINTTFEQGNYRLRIREL